MKSRRRRRRPAAQSEGLDEMRGGLRPSRPALHDAVGIHDPVVKAPAGLGGGGGPARRPLPRSSAVKSYNATTRAPSNSSGRRARPTRRTRTSRYRGACVNNAIQALQPATWRGLIRPQGDRAPRAVPGAAAPVSRAGTAAGPTFSRRSSSTSPSAQGGRHRCRAAARSLAERPRRVLATVPARRSDRDARLSETSASRRPRRRGPPSRPRSPGAPARQRRSRRGRRRPRAVACARAWLRSHLLIPLRRRRRGSPQRPPPRPALRLPFVPLAAFLCSPLSSSSPPLRVNDAGWRSPT